MDLDNSEAIARGGAHLVKCKSLLEQLDGAGMMVRNRREVSQARESLLESMRLTRALLARVKTDLEKNNGDSQS